jgi:hypothetical protein
VKIYDDDGIQESELIGCTQVSLKDLEPGKVKDVWLKLVKDLEIQRDRKDRGQVRPILLEKNLFAFLESELIDLQDSFSFPYLHFSRGILQNWVHSLVLM